MTFVWFTLKSEILHIYIFLFWDVNFSLKWEIEKPMSPQHAADKQHCLMICWDLYWLIHIHIALCLAKSSQDPLQIRLFPRTYCSAPCIVKDCWFICIFLMKSVCSYLRLTIIKCCILSICSHLCLFLRFQLC